MSTTSRRSYERLIEAVKALPPISTSVAHPCDESSLAGAVDAAKLGIIAPILVGPQKKILAAALGGLDAIVFTAGIGERAVAIREAVCRRAAWLGVELDPTANSGHGPRHQHRFESRFSLGDSYQRGADDRAPYAHAGRAAIGVDVAFDGPYAARDAGRVGARLLLGLSEPARGFHRWLGIRSDRAQAAAHINEQ